MASFHGRVLVVVLGCAMSACASRAPTRIVLPRADQVAVSQAQAQVDDPRRQGERAELQEDRDHKSYVLPVVQILAMDAAFNLVGRALYEPATFEVTSKTIRRNLRGPWAVSYTHLTLPTILRV